MTDTQEDVVVDFRDFLRDLADAASRNDAVAWLLAKAAQTDALVSDVKKRNPEYRETGVADLLRSTAQELTSLRSQNKVMREALEWKPIETAPHETAVLLYSPPTDWSALKIEVGFASGGRRIRLSNGDVASTMHWHGTATNWMPLPPPPALSPTSKDETPQ